MKSIIIVRLNPAITAYMASEAAIPRPDMNPDFQFLFTVRLIHSIPNGPKGIETANPIIKPSQSRNKLMLLNKPKKNEIHFLKLNHKVKIRPDIFYFYPIEVLLILYKWNENLL